MWRLVTLICCRSATALAVCDWTMRSQIKHSLEREKQKSRELHTASVETRAAPPTGPNSLLVSLRVRRERLAAITAAHIAPVSASSAQDVQSRVSKLLFTCTQHRTTPSTTTMRQTDANTITHAYLQRLAQRFHAQHRYGVETEVESGECNGRPFECRRQRQ
jgi:hypothetical protein